MTVLIAFSQNSADSVTQLLIKSVIAKMVKIQMSNLMTMGSYIKYCTVDAMSVLEQKCLSEISI